ncbi:major capsid protein [Capybara microvirus Cap1_SP_145]|nr:major capsid protein [Capybara microvirus Cap1_SP_145]
MSNFNAIAAFKAPKYSQYNKNHNHVTSASIGKLFPIFVASVPAGCKERLSLEQVTRFSPLQAPIFEQFKLSVDLFQVPYRILGGNLEQFFNKTAIQHDDNGMPHISYRKYLETWFALKNTEKGPDFNHYMKSSLWDYLGYPIDSSLYKKIPYITWTYGGKTYNFSDISSPTSNVLLMPQGTVFKYKTGQYTIPTGYALRNYSMWSIFKLFGIEAPSSTSLYQYVYENHKEFVLDDETVDLDAVFKKFGNISYQKSIDIYKDYVYSMIAFTMQSADFNVNITRFLAYRRVYLDWYINTNLSGDVDEMLQTQVYEAALDGLSGEMGNTMCYEIENRWWQNDLFTSCTPNSQQGNAVSIPSSGTILDLRNANRLQEFKERLNYAGRRFKDYLRAVFGASLSDGRLQRSEFLGRCDWTVKVSEVTQTSESTPEKPLGSFVGQAGSIGKDYGWNTVITDEPTILIAIASIRPRLSYMSSTDKDIYKLNYYDYLLPQFAELGDQAVTKGEVSFTAGTEPTSLFGFNRRYCDYQYKSDKVTGNMRDELDYWHSARTFDTAPVLNEQFAKMSPFDGFDRIFANIGEPDNIYCWFNIQWSSLLPIPKYIHYHL